MNDVEDASTAPGDANPEPTPPPTETPAEGSADVVDDARVEPFETGSDVESEKLAEGRVVAVVQYSPAKAREGMRVGLGITIVAAALIAGAAGAINAASSGTGTNTILTAVFSPLLGLAGAVVGFYFGGKDTSA